MLDELQISTQLSASSVLIGPIAVAPCRAPRAPFAARHFFSRYKQDRVTGDQLIAIHFDEVYCVNRAALYTTAGCLHQVYASKGGP